MGSKKTYSDDEKRQIVRLEECKSFLQSANKKNGKRVCVQQHLD